METKCCHGHLSIPYIREVCRQTKPDLTSQTNTAPLREQEEESMKR
jgi:hypothetical protein